MASPDPGSFIDPERVSIVSGLLFLLWSNLRRWWMTAGEFRERMADKDKQIELVTEDRNFYRKGMFEAIQGQQRSNTVIEKVIEAKK